MHINNHVWDLHGVTFNGGLSVCNFFFFYSSLFIDFRRGILIQNLEAFTFPPTVRLQCYKYARIVYKMISTDLRFAHPYLFVAMYITFHRINISPCIGRDWPRFTAIELQEFFSGSCELWHGTSFVCSIRCTHRIHTLCRAVGSGTVISCFLCLGLSRLGFTLIYHKRLIDWLFHCLVFKPYFIHHKVSNFCILSKMIIPKIM